MSALLDSISSHDPSEMDLLRLKKLMELRDARVRFAVDHHVNTRGEPMDFDHYPHIRDLYNTIAPVVVLQGSVQSFKSEWAIIDHFACASLGLSVFFVLPKYDMRTTFVQNRVNRCVESVEEYRRLIRDGFFDSVSLKNFGRGSIKYVGSNVLADFKEFPADVLVVEEVDECDQDNVEYALDRLRASLYQFRRYLGNPRVRGRGINAMFLLSDQREWFVPCTVCGDFHKLDWFDVVVKTNYDASGQVIGYQLRDEAWEPGCRRDVRCVCPSCGGEVERASPSGEWRPMNPGTEMEGYHISMLCSPLNSVAGMWARFQRALDDPLRLQQFYNSDLGLPYSAAGNRITAELLDVCSESPVITPYRFDIPDERRGHIVGDCHPGPCSMGVDVGGNFDVSISTVDRGRRISVYLGKIKPSIDELVELILRYNVEKCVMDSQPEITLAREFQDSAPCDVWLCRFRGEGKEARRAYQLSERIILCDRTEVMDRAYGQIRRGVRVVPTNYAALMDGAFSREMCGPVREAVLDERGNTKFIWAKCIDHQRLADAYDLLASDLVIEAIIDAVYVG